MKYLLKWANQRFLRFVDCIDYHQHFHKSFGLSDSGKIDFGRNISLILSEIPSM